MSNFYLIRKNHFLKFFLLKIKLSEINEKSWEINTLFKMMNQVQPISSKAM